MVAPLVYISIVDACVSYQLYNSNQLVAIMCSVCNCTVSMTLCKLMCHDSDQLVLERSLLNFLMCVIHFWYLKLAFNCFSSVSMDKEWN